MPVCNVVVEGENRDRPFADGKHGTRYYGRDLAGKAGAVEREFAFDRGAMPGQFLPMHTRYIADDALGLRRFHPPEAMHRLAQAFLP